MTFLKWSIVQCVWERVVPQSYDCHWQIKIMIILYNNYSSIRCTTLWLIFAFQFCSHTSSSNQHWMALISICQLLGTKPKHWKNNLTSNFFVISYPMSFNDLDGLKLSKATSGGATPFTANPCPSRTYSCKEETLKKLLTYSTIQYDIQ